MRWSGRVDTNLTMRIEGKLAGDSWGWNAICAAYKQIEDNEAGADDYRGAGGRYSHFCKLPRDLHPLVDTFLASAQAMAINSIRF